MSFSTSRLIKSKRLTNKKESNKANQSEYYDKSKHTNLTSSGLDRPQISANTSNKSNLVENNSKFKDKSLSTCSSNYKLRASQRLSNIIENDKTKLAENQHKGNLKLSKDLSGTTLVKPTNASVEYKTLAEINTSALMGHLPSKVNIFCVVRQILKSLCSTPAEKFKIMIEAIDQTLAENDSIPVIHFFTKEDTIIKQISQGDVLRLHRIKMELHCSDIHGQICNSSDITLFKLKSPAFISLDMNTVVTELEKRKVEELKTWFQQSYMGSLLSKVVLLSDIITDGTCKLFCKIIGDPYEHDGCLKMLITDGTTTQDLSPASPIAEAVEGNQSLATELTIRLWNSPGISIEALCKAYKAIIKSGSYILFNMVNVRMSNCLTLELNTESKNKFVVISEDNEAALEIKRRIENDCKKVVKQLDRSALKRSITVSSFQNKTSPVKQKSVEDNVETIKKIKTKPKNESTVGQARRTLFTANSADWSDATEEVSENSPPTLGDIKEKDPVEALSSNHSISDLFNLLKDPSCSPPVESKNPEASFTKSNDEMYNVEIGDHRDGIEDELDPDCLKSLLGIEEDLTSLITSPIIRVSVFVDGILPDPEGDHYDLVSGVCEEGCNNAFLFSVISWIRKDSEIRPTCPACEKVGRFNNLKLMFMFELDVFDMRGKCERLLVAREHAEKFLSCSVEEYLKDQSQKEKCVKSLKALTRNMESEKKRPKRPKLCANIICVRNLYCLVDTKFDFPLFIQNAVDIEKS